MSPLPLHPLRLLHFGFICSPKVLSFHSTGTHLPLKSWQIHRTYGFMCYATFVGCAHPLIHLFWVPAWHSGFLLSSVDFTSTSSLLPNQQFVSMFLLMSSHSLFWVCIASSSWPWVISNSKKVAKVLLEIKYIFCTYLWKMFIIYLRFIHFRSDPVKSTTQSASQSSFVFKLIYLLLF